MNAQRHIVLLLAAGLVGLALTATGCGGSESTYAERPAPPRRSFAMLDEYGDWLDVPQYGEIWRPHVMSGWEPYVYGHWRWTDRGWLWVSYEPFGWVVYHYGSWVAEPQLGWVWVPGYDWYPADVRWVDYGEYVAWAPAPPPGSGLIEPDQDWQYQTWIMVPAARFVSDDVGTYRTRSTGTRLPPPRQEQRQAPEVRKIERVTGNRVDPIRVETEDVTAGDHEIVRVKLPPEDSRRVQSHAEEIDREVLHPRKGPPEQPVTPKAQTPADEGTGKEVLPPAKGQGNEAPKERAGESREVIPPAKPKPPANGRDAKKQNVKKPVRKKEDQQKTPKSDKGQEKKEKEPKKPIEST